MASVPRGPGLLSGGEFGAEGSLITVIVTAALVLYIWKAKWIKPPEDRAALWRRYPAGFGWCLPGLMACPEINLAKVKPLLSPRHQIKAYP